MCFNQVNVIMSRILAWCSMDRLYGDWCFLVGHGPMVLGTTEPQQDDWGVQPFPVRNSWVSRYGGMVWLFIAGKINETHQTGWAISHGHIWLLQGNHELPQFAKEHLGMSRCSVYVADHRWNPHFLRPIWGRLWVWMGPGTKAVGGCTICCCHVLVPIYRSLQTAQIWQGYRSIWCPNLPFFANVQIGTTLVSH